MMNDQQDMNKRIFLFFLVIAVLLVGFTVIQSYLFPTQTQKTEHVEKTAKTEKTEVSQHIQSTNSTDIKGKPAVNYVGGAYNLLLGSKRVSSDDLKEFVKINTDFGHILISKVGARVISIYVKRYNFDVISKFSKNNRLFPTEIITTDPEITSTINFSKYTFSQNGNHYIFTLKKGNIEVVKDFVLNEDMTISLNIKTKGLEKIGLAVISGVGIESSGRFGHSGAVVKTDKELITLDPDIKTEQIIRGNILWAGEENKYFIQLLSNKNGFSAVHVVPIGGKHTAVISEIPHSLNGFFFGGPKLYSLLGKITDRYKKEWGVDLSLKDTVNFGIFGILGKPLFVIMHFIYRFVHNWGLTIIILTVLLRIVLFPLNHKSLKSMKKMSDLAPEIKKLQKKYKDDPQKLQQEMMKLYAEHGANPMSGCLPIVAQIPIFIALYNVLMVTVELKNVPFLWIPDLSDKDPFYILPILMGLSMIAQQFITPSSDKNQKMIMYIMAGVFTFMFMNFPAGLVLYWLTNNILGIGQSFIINKQLGRYDKK